MLPHITVCVCVCTCVRMCVACAYCIHKDLLYIQITITTCMPRPHLHGRRTFLFIWWIYGFNQMVTSCSEGTMVSSCDRFKQKEQTKRATCYLDLPGKVYIYITTQSAICKTYTNTLTHTHILAHTHTHEHTRTDTNTHIKRFTHSSVNQCDPKFASRMLAQMLFPKSSSSVPSRAFSILRLSRSWYFDILIHWYSDTLVYDIQYDIQSLRGLSLLASLFCSAKS